MEAMTIIGSFLGILGFIFALAARKRIDKLIKHLKENDIIDEGYSDSK